MDMSKQGSALRAVGTAATEIKVEKGVPAPLAKRNRRALPFEGMEVGDSIFVPCADAKEQICIAGAAYYYAQKSRRSFTARKSDDGVRIWRVE